MTLSKDMRAVRYHRRGTPDVLILEEVQRPVAGPGQALIRVEAAGVNFADVVQRGHGYYPASITLPAIAGSEFIGWIDSVGPGVTLQTGTRVIGSCPGAGYAEYVAVPAVQLASVPEDLPAAVALALFIQGLTAWFMLTEAAKLAAGEAVLIPSAGGGVGSLAVQIAADLGAGHIVALASSEQNRHYAHAAGATAVIDSSQSDWSDEITRTLNGRALDIVLDRGGGKSMLAGLSLLGPFGRLVVFGSSDGQLLDVPVGGLLERSISVTGFFLATYFAHRPQVLGAALDALVQRWREGRVKPLLGPSFALGEAAAAHALLESRTASGKIVLEVSSQ
ncbi:NADPH2:quinone reductase [Novosphingobium sp. SG751A]|uniref:quinone oxidoreductase family protein n=1 Tax=Novosphingobium sp. SG751A TaxID=2587000 RepID=UPI0015571619|nr:zinc-binding dehydrogenase [Novosphingobium sp. SG751A]NOW48781.1 NADPH2:quinone reductase [Novosphingobium sp. SG751A]